MEPIVLTAVLLITSLSVCGESVVRDCWSVATMGDQLPLDLGTCSFVPATSVNFNYSSLKSLFSRRWALLDNYTSCGFTGSVCCCKGSENCCMNTPVSSYCCLWQCSAGWGGAAACGSALLAGVVLLLVAVLCWLGWCCCLWQCSAGWGGAAACGSALLAGVVLRWLLEVCGVHPC